MLTILVMDTDDTESRASSRLRCPGCVGLHSSSVRCGTRGDSLGGSIGENVVNSTIAGNRTQHYSFCRPIQATFSPLNASRSADACLPRGFLVHG
jgi:hypothetical protein